MLDIKAISARVRRCPKCGNDHYSTEMFPGSPLRTKSIRCANCGADILKAYKAAQPVGFELVVGDLDRLILMFGAALLAVAGLWVVFSS